MSMMSGAVLAGRALGSEGRMWEFPKIRGTLFWGPYNNKDPII